jgi:hypothetical protein
MIYYIHAKSSDEIFELGAIYGLLHAWNLSKLTADSEYWRKGDITREQELELLEMPMEERIKFDSIKVSNLDVATTLDSTVICFESDATQEQIQEFIDTLVDYYDIYYGDLKVEV